MWFIRRLSKRKQNEEETARKLEAVEDMKSAVKDAIAETSLDSITTGSTGTYEKVEVKSDTANGVVDTKV